MAEHLYNSRKHRNKSFIDSAIGKYGINAFEISVVEKCADNDELDYREKFWITKLNSKVPNGYNLTDGGDGVAGRPLSDEHRKKISKANLGKKRSESTRKKMSECLKGHRVTEETRKKLSVNSKLKKAVRCIENGKIFDSITAAAKWANVSVNAISIALRGKTKKSANYHWEYVEEH